MVTATVFNFGTNAHPATSSEEVNRHPPLLPKRKNMSAISNQTTQETNTVSQNLNNSTNNMDIDDFKLPKRKKKFRKNFIKLLEQKAAATIKTDNRFEVISESESDTETEPTSSRVKCKATPNLPLKGRYLTKPKECKNCHKSKA